MNFKILERYLRVNLLGPGPSSYKKIIYRAAVSQRLGNTALEGIQLRSPISYQYTCAQLHTSSEPSYPSCCYYITIHKSCDK
jgi:hypothetical protein